MTWQNVGGALILLVPGLMAVPRASAAQTPAAAASALNLTVEEAARLAVEHAPRLAEARAREAAAESNLAALYATSRVSGAVSAGYQRGNHVDVFLLPTPDGPRGLFPDIPNTYRVRAEVNIPVYAFGRVGATLDAARAEIKATGADRSTVNSDVRLDATRAYWWLVTARTTVRVFEESLARTDAYVNDVKARVDAGVLPPNDVLSAQAQRGRQYVRLIQARNDEALAELDLARLVGAPPGTRIATTTPAEEPAAGTAQFTSANAAQLVDRALAARSERTALTERSAGLRSSAMAALANTRPYLSSQVAVEPSRPNMRFLPPTDAWNTSWLAGINVTWPLFDSGKSKAEHAALTAQATAVDARRTELENLVSLEVRQRLLELESSRAAIVAAAESVVAATEARRVVDERFRAGVATSTEVLDAQVAQLESEVEHTRLQAALRIGEARLLRALGGQ
jgi:outer membrane protein TolC